MEAPEARNQGLPSRSQIPDPTYRRLRGYAFDPSLSTQLEDIGINEVTFKVRWEKPSSKEHPKGALDVGPVGEYLEIVDYDPASDRFYEPVDLNDPLVLAQDGLQPSEGNPLFHQQMVYAVAMTTIGHFERALGRVALWRPLYIDEKPAYDEHDDSRPDLITQPNTEGRRGPEMADCGEGPKPFRSKEKYVKRLRIYPHALRQANAFYSPDKRALLFGYFTASPEAAGKGFPGGTVFTCLSHDVIAHETTHALLDGMHRKFIEPTQKDALAFHEAFADIVALFQHFTFPEVVSQQIARTRGDLMSQNMLGQLAQEVGLALGQYGALRDAIGEIDPATGVWQLQKPDPRKLEDATEPHERGAILVAAVFDAFLSIYKNRVADLLRIASGGTGILTLGALHPDLVHRLAGEATKSAEQVLTMCIRALDYCPSVDITFGDYLRALITADMDLVPDDDLGYRVAFLEAFRRRGIYPKGIRTLSLESLRWPVAPADERTFKPISDLLRDFQEKSHYFETREAVFIETAKMRKCLHDFLSDEYAHHEAFEELTGLILTPNKGLPPELEAEGLYLSYNSFRKEKRPRFEIHSLRPANRIGPDGNVLNQLIISIMQSSSKRKGVGAEASNMKFRGGCTLILDLTTLELRYAIPKRLNDVSRWWAQKDYWENGLTASLQATYFGNPFADSATEPFAFLHSNL